MIERALQNQRKITLRGIAVLIICGITPFMRYTVGGRGLLSLMMLIIIGAYFIGVIKNVNFSHVKLEKYQKWVLLLTVVYLVSPLFSSWNQAISFENMKVQLCTLVLFTYIANRKETRVEVALSCLAAILFIYLYIYNGEYYLGGIRQYIALQEGVYLDPNIITASFIIPCVWASRQVLEKRKIWVKIILVAFIFTSLYFSFLGGSRAGILAILIGIGICFVVSFKPTFKHIVIGLIALLVLCVGIVILYSNLPIELQQRMSFTGIQSTDGAGRGDIWSRYISQFFDSNPLRMLFGYGKESCVNLLGRASHNTIIDYLWDLGVIGLVLYGITIFQCVKFTIKKKNGIAIGSIFAVIVWSLTISASDQLIFWVLIYTIICIAKNDLEKT